MFASPDGPFRPPCGVVMKRFATFHLSGFAVEALAGESELGSEQLTEQMTRAIYFYLSDRGSEKPGWAFPDFMRDRPSGEEVVVKLRIDRDVWRELGEEADRQNVSVPMLLEHAALYLAAELNAGRLTERILESEGEGDAEEGNAA